ncbi:MAG: hypothetical protein PHQ80_03400 [Candidatus ainarchaeum sp.]|nr:hypothetical protein [Candidatus ainarchaeum sp.]MDD5096538.1 hypothetical protein [Candidatus ainarchaeum sp.]
MEGQHVKNSLRGQASVEMLATVGLVLLLLVPILLLLLVGAQVRFEDISSIQASAAARVMSDSINEVYIEGPGASKVAVVNLPSNNVNVSFTGSEVVLTLLSGSAQTQVTYPYFGKLAEGDRDARIEGKRGLIAIRFYNEAGEVRFDYEGKQ